MLAASAGQHAGPKCMRTGVEDDRWVHEVAGWAPIAYAWLVTSTRPPLSTARMSPGQSGMPGTGLSRRAGPGPGRPQHPEQAASTAIKDPQPATGPARPITSSATAKVLQHALDGLDSTPKRLPGAALAGKTPRTARQPGKHPDHSLMRARHRLSSWCWAPVQAGAASPGVVTSAAELPTSTRRSEPRPCRFRLFRTHTPRRRR